MDQFVCYCMLHYSAVCDITVSVIGLTYNLIIARYLFYDFRDVPVSEKAASFSFSVLYLIFVEVTIYLIVVHFGYKYLDADLPRESNESLLNNSKEGVLIIDESTAEVRFHNKAAKRLNKRIRATCNFSIIQKVSSELMATKSLVDVENARLISLDKESLFEANHQNAIKMLSDVDQQTLSLGSIIKGLLDSPNNKKGLYRIELSYQSALDGN